MTAARLIRQVSTSSSRLLASRRLASTTCRTHPAALFSFSKCSRTFSTSLPKFGQGATDLSLSQKLQEELKYENDSNPEKEAPEFLKAFEAQGIWKLEDLPGGDEITLTRSFGNENLRLMFSIADMETEEEDFTTDEETEESRDADATESLHTYPLRACLSITKASGSGCLNVDLICQEGQFVVENFSFYADAKLGTDLTAESDWKRRGYYVGPQFDTLDPTLQEELDKYLRERGVDEHIALFIPEYAEYKEQTEYVRWLKNVKSFVDQ